MSIQSTFEFARVTPAIASKELPHRAKLVMIALTTGWPRAQWRRVSVADLARKVGLSERTVQRGLADLVQSGLITRHRSGQGRATRTEFCGEVAGGAASPPGRTADQGETTDRHEPDTPTVSPPDTPTVSPPETTAVSPPETTAVSRPTNTVNHTPKETNNGSSSRVDLADPRHAWAVREYGRVWVDRALEITSRHTGMGWGYTVGVLKQFRAQGGPLGDPPKRQTPTPREFHRARAPVTRSAEEIADLRATASGSGWDARLARAALRGEGLV